MQTKKDLFILSPFELPNEQLVLSTMKTGAFPFLHLGRNQEKAKQVLTSLVEKTDKPFGVCITSEEMANLELPANVKAMLLPLGIEVTQHSGIELYYQIHSLPELDAAVESGIKNIVLKGNEGAGKVANKSTFVLFQTIKTKYPDSKANIYLHGGMGVHSSAAALALGAKGVIMDSQIALFPECQTPKEIKDTFSKLSGSETSIIDNFRILLRKNSPSLPALAQKKDIIPFLNGLDLSQNIIPLGQDIALAIDFVEQYKNIKGFTSAFFEAAYSHLHQVKAVNSIYPKNALAKDLNIEYPIAQGPMARISDVPEFAHKVAEAGALPFLAMSLSKGESAQRMLAETKHLMDGKTWGVGILGFVPAELRDAQTQYILDVKPPVVLIAGGRPSLAKPFEKEGIKVFIHVPSSSLLDMFMKEGARNFIFEGRESGGHIGPLLSMVLWEKQINRLLKEEDLSTFSIFFAGGIHDALSSAFVSIMSTSLAVKGAKIGVIMGTSYLYTKEAVETGAIQDEYQKQSIIQEKTVLLEAAPGQETQSLVSPFTDFFIQEKQRLQKQNLDSKEIWTQLEELNIGRLRIAAKGVERKGNDLIQLDKKEQFEKGLYMIGQVAVLCNEVTTMNALHSSVTIDNNTLISKLEDISLPEPEEKPLDIAIVGLSGFYPDAKNIDEYWKNIILGKDCVTEVPDNRWNKDLYYNPDTRDTDYVVSKWGGFLPAIDFDPLEFGITPQSLASIEPTQLLSLLAAKRALEDAGYTNLAELDRENTSVIFGAEGATELAASYGFRGYAKQVFGELPDNVKNSLPKLNEDSFAGVLSNVISGRIANRLDLGGRNYTVDAACASSLAALDIGCQELVSNRSDMVILGGTDMHNGINDFLMFSCTHALSRKGYSASFDADSDGIALGEGIGVLIMKRLDDAVRDGNKIYAVIKGMGGSSDGKSLGMTAPNSKGQVKALQRAYQSAGILPSQVGLIEAHGTGTVVGDKTELKALTEMFLSSGAVPGQTHLGSVKTQIGHTKCAAGIAGAIKAILSVYYGIKPPTIHLNKPNPYYKEETSPFVFNTQAGLWNSDRRIAGISAFGFGGTNFHVVLENYNKSVSHASALPAWPAELFVFRGNNMDEAKQQMQKIKQLITLNDSILLKDIAYSLATYNNKEVQVSILAGDINSLSDKIDIALSGKESQDIYYRKPQDGKVAFLFSGQGSQRINMARDLMVAFPAMRKLLLQNKEYEKIIYPDAAFDESVRKQQQTVITDTRNAQPALGIVDLAIADFLRSLDINPDMVSGHSYGEIPALCFAGAFKAEELVPLSRKRALSILDAVKDDKGKMVAVSLPEEELNKVLEGETEVWAVNFNSHKQTVLAGSTPGMAAFMKKMDQTNIAYREINVACAFHSPLLNDAKRLYSNVLADIEFKSPSIPVWSNTTAQLYPTSASEIKERLAEHLIKPVLFCNQVENMYKDGARIFIETGPSKVLIGLVQSILGNDITAIQTEGKGNEGIGYLLGAIAKYMSTGRNINVAKLFEDRNVSSIDIDDVEKYKKKATVWHINGHNAIPSVGKLPSQGALPITQPIMSLKNMSQQNSNNNNHSAADQVVLEYLQSMRTMIQNQRDVMLGYLGQNVPVRETQIIEIQPTYTSQPTVTLPAPAIVAPIPTATVQPVTVQVPSVGNVKALLLDIVSEKTGYPVDMLGLDLDLEADLSVDSIKRMEIVGALRDRLNISGGLEDSEDTVEKIASVKTLNGLIAWIEELAGSHQSTPVSTTATISPQPLVSQPTATTQAPSVENVKTLLLEIVSEKTGYPTDMLGLDLDLEADLSIDSIKRMEIVGALRDKLNISGGLEDSEDTVEKIASVKTLNGLIAWIEELAGNHQSAPGATNNDSQTIVTNNISDSSPAPTIDPTSTPTAQVTVEDVKNMLLEIVSEKTGYPTDMLGLDLDLEADLSIDSIKRMEIVGALRDKLNISGGLEDSEDTVEKIASVKTLNGLITWIEELANPEKPVVQNTIVKEKEIREVKDKLYRMLFEFEELPFKSMDENAVNGKKIAITDDGGGAAYAKDIKKLLESKGAIVDIISVEDNISSYDGLIILNVSESPIHYSINDVFCMIKNANMEQIKWVYTFSDIMGSIGESKDMGALKGIQGFPGLLKSLAREYSHVNFRATVFLSLFERDSLPQIVLNELSSATNDQSEVVYNNSVRMHRNLKRQDIETDGPSNLKFDKDAVVVVFGGAQGITPGLLAQLSLEYPCNYILVGRSSEPSNEDAKYASLITKDEIRNYLIKQEGMTSPAEVEKRVQQIFKSNQIVSAKHLIAKTGANVVYKSLDITNEKALREFIQGIYAQYGRIDGLIHAAGVLEDKLFSHKTLDSFSKVYSTKVTPLHIVLSELRPDIKLIVLFSSVASAYGNRGQTDYAAANSVLDLATIGLNKKTDARILTINWGPWKGAGMVSDGLEAEFRKRGVSLIPLQTGSSYFVNELKYGQASQVLIMGGVDGVEQFTGF